MVVVQLLYSVPALDSWHRRVPLVLGAREVIQELTITACLWLWCSP